MGNRSQQLAALRSSDPLARRATLGDLTTAMLPAPITADMRPADDGSIKVGKFRLSALGLQAERGITQQDWCEVGEFLKQADSAMQWWIGDWVNSCDAAWGKTYELAMEVTGYAETTLTNFAYVARQIEFSLRNENLSFGHHNLIARIETIEKRREWLEYAASEKLSVAALRKAIAGKPNGGVETPGLQIAQLPTRAKLIVRALGRLDKLNADQRRSALDEINIIRQICDQAEAALLPSED